MIFVASAISPQELPLVLKRLIKLLKPGGLLFLRDYARNDLGQVRAPRPHSQLIRVRSQLRFGEGRRVGDHQYQCTDGTLRYYFTTEQLGALFTEVRVCVARSGA